MWDQCFVQLVPTVWRYGIVFVPIPIPRIHIQIDAASQAGRQASNQQPARQRDRETETDRAGAEAGRVRRPNPPRPISYNFRPTPPITHHLPRGFSPRPSGAQNRDI